MQVEMLDHAKEFKLKQNRCGTLMIRLVYLVKVEQVGSRKRLSQLQQTVHSTRNITKGPPENCKAGQKNSVSESRTGVVTWPAQLQVPVTWQGWSHYSPYQL